MHPVKLLKAGLAWNVVADGHLSSCADLDLAAAKALSLAESLGTSVELGAGVPPEALERERKRRQRGHRAAG